MRWRALATGFMVAYFGDAGFVVAAAAVVLVSGGVTLVKLLLPAGAAAAEASGVGLAGGWAGPAGALLIGPLPG